MPNGRVQITQPKLVIVEGKDEENFFTAALNSHLGLAEVQILPVGGKTQLTGSLKALKLDPSFPSVQSLAVIRDADMTPAGSTVTAAVSAFDAVRSALTARGVELSCPAGHAQFADGPPRIGVYIMPDGVMDGMLETLCVNSISAQPVYTCVTDFFACCQGHGPPPTNIHKARAHVWLASRLVTGRRVGEAALANEWPFADSAFQTLWTFLQMM